MKLGVVTTALLHLPVDQGLDLARALGLTEIEVACAGYHENLAYGDPLVLARDGDARERWLDRFATRDLTVSAFALHGAPLSPDPAVAARWDEQFRAACELAQQIGVDRFTLCAGLPEGAPGDRTPCWVVSAWPAAENARILAYQWQERVLPYWRERVAVAAAHGVTLCFELQAWDVVHNPRTLLRLRQELGERVAANVDPSHLFWQAIDPLAAVRALGPAIGWVHAKDTRIEPAVADVNGLLDATPYSQVAERAWNFRALGYGHDARFWAELVSTLRMVGYDDVISIEHEDQLSELTEGLTKSARLLHEVNLERQPGLSAFHLSLDDAAAV